MKLLLNVTLILISVFIGALQGQNATNKGGAPSAHEARFTVTDAGTKSPVAKAVLFDKTGKQLGQTDMYGKLVISLPASDKEVYTVRASGYKASEVKLNNASKKAADYQVLLMSSKEDMSMTPQKT